jgi:hypothetical protein
VNCICILNLSTTFYTVLGGVGLTPAALLAFQVDHAVNTFRFVWDIVLTLYTTGHITSRQGILDSEFW